jgi:hypothetical protein
VTGTSTANHAFNAAATHASKGFRLNLRIFEWIWHVEGSVPLAPGQSSDDAFDRLDPLFRERGTSRDRTQDTLTFTKKEAAAQDKMVVFDSGVLRIEQDAAGPVLRYRLTSRALLFCLLAPLLFLFLAQATVFLGSLEKPKVEAKDKKAKKPPAALNPIDKFLGAPAPEKPKKGKDKEDDKKPSPTPGYVFAGMFAVLYAFGRYFEARRIKALFRTRLLGG